MISTIFSSILIFYFLLSLYASRSLKTFRATQQVRWLFWGVVIAIVLYLLYQWLGRGKMV